MQRRRRPRAAAMPAYFRRTRQIIIVPRRCSPAEALSTEEFVSNPTHRRDQRLLRLRYGHSRRRVGRRRIAPDAERSDNREHAGRLNRRSPDGRRRSLPICRSIHLADPDTRQCCLGARRNVQAERELAPVRRKRVALESERRITSASAADRIYLAPSVGVLELDPARPSHRRGPVPGLHRSLVDALPTTWWRGGGRHCRGTTLRRRTGAMGRAERANLVDASLGTRSSLRTRYACADASAARRQLCPSLSPPAAARAAR